MNDAPQPLNEQQLAMLSQLEIKHRALLREYKTTVGVHRYYERMYNFIAGIHDDEAIAIAIDSVLNDVIICSVRLKRLDRQSAIFELMDERLRAVLKRLDALVVSLEEIALVPYQEAYKNHAKDA